MRLDDGVIEKARQVGGEKTAAKLYNSIEHELAFGADNEDDYDRGEQALRILDERFPGVEAQAREITQPPQLSRQAGRRVREEPHQPLRAQTEREHDVRRRTSRGVGGRVATATAIHARPRRGGGWGGRRFGQTGIPGAAEGTAQFTMQVIGWIAGLAFFSVLLSPRGSRAVQLGFGGLTHAFTLLASPGVDPLQKSTWKGARPPAVQQAPVPLAPAVDVVQMNAAARALSAGAAARHPTFATRR